MLKSEIAYIQSTQLIACSHLAWVHLLEKRCRVGTCRQISLMM